MGEFDVTIDRDYWVGGSDIPAIMGVSSFSTPYELALKKLKLEPTQEGSSDVFMQKYIDFGNTMEPQIRDYINEKYGTNYKPDQRSLEDERLRANVDGWDEGARVPLLEIKTYGDTFRGEEFEWQIQAYMYIYDVKECLLVGYRRQKPTDLFSFDDFDMAFDPDKITEIIVTREEDMIERLLDKVPDFIDALDEMKERFTNDNDVMPDMEFTLKLAHDNQLAERMNELDDVINQMRKVEALVEREQEIKAEIQKLMIERNIKTIDTGVNRVTVSPASTSTKFDSTAFKKDYPDLFAKYQKVSNRKASIRVTSRD